MNNIEEIKMMFIGEDSLGYENGKTYNLTINGDRSLLNPKYKDCPIVIERVGGGGLCPYSSLESFVENWTLPNLLTQQREEVVRGFVEFMQKKLGYADMRGMAIETDAETYLQSLDKGDREMKQRFEETMREALALYLIEEQPEYDVFTAGETTETDLVEEMEGSLTYNDLLIEYMWQWHKSEMMRVLDELESIGNRYKNENYKTDNFVINGKKWDKYKAKIKEELD